MAFFSHKLWLIVDGVDKLPLIVANVVTGNNQYDQITLIFDAFTPKPEQFLISAVTGDTGIDGLNT